MFRLNYDSLLMIYYKRFSTQNFRMAGGGEIQSTHERAA